MVFLFVLIAIIVGILLFLKFTERKDDIVVQSYQIKDPRIKENLRIAVLADMHSTLFGQDQSLVKIYLKEIQPDLLFLCGDIIDNRKDIDYGLSLVKDFAKKIPSFYVLGNHEIYTGRHEYIKEKMKESGYRVLEGNGLEIEVASNNLLIYGLEDPTIGHTYQVQVKDLSQIKSDKITLLLSHKPQLIEDYKKIGFDYVFSGHAHGGQWVIPNLLEDGFMASDQGLFPKYTNGIHEFENFKLIISRGMSNDHILLPRINVQKEILVLDIVNK